VVDLLIRQAKAHKSTLIMVTHDRSLLDSFERVIDFEELTGAMA
jgi:ABC-type lipoprotein export system ATPase subunit